MSDLRMNSAVGMSHWGLPTYWKRSLSQRCSGPGGVYNIGNLIALVGGLTIQTLSAPEAQTLSAAAWHFLFGSIGASCLTLSMLIHFASGEAYHRACHKQNRLRPNLMRFGDTLSGIGAVVLTIAVVSYGNATLALIAGIMFSIGKFGSAMFSGAARSTKPEVSVALGFRLLAVASRVPSIAALAITIVMTSKTSDSIPDMAITILMLGCYLIWLRADCLLIGLNHNASFRRSRKNRLSSQVDPSEVRG